ncbi:MAG: lipocalin-like domain-containing protein [Vicinamibacterales bacterium]
MLALLAAVAAPAAAQWKEAAPGYEYAFPRDHASHPAYKIEWWYYTGNLDAADGRRFGYQVTFFRVGVDQAPENPSRWAVRDLFMTHLAVTDVSNGEYVFRERLNRAGPGIAGADTSRYHVWNEDWQARLGPDGRHVITAEKDGVGVTLALDEGKAPVIHGRNGISQKGAQAGNASHYYSLTRMPTSGTITIDGETVEVTGLSWMDHEFGTSFLEEDQQGWDWISAQLDDGSELMIYQLRRGDGSVDPRSSGTFVAPDGRVRRFTRDEFRLTTLGPTFRSRASGADYPTAWRVELPSEGLDISVRAAVENQELRTPESTGVTYWEGAIDIDGSRAGRDVGGRGYLEMTGYGGFGMGKILSNSEGRRQK